MKISLLSRLKSEHGTWLYDRHEKAWVYHVNTPHVLIQAAGYLKYAFGRGNAKGVFYRGQEKLYLCSLQPSLYRGLKSVGSRNRKHSMLNRYMRQCSMGACFSDVPDFAREPLMQHYGIRTKWIDIVDNIWVALWFACHTTRNAGKRKEYLHFEQRYMAATSYAYIVLVAVGIKQDSNRAGYYYDDDTELVDLRIAAPSTFLRPHVQHGLLAKAIMGGDNRSVDYREMMVGIIRIKLEDAIRWLGDGSLLTPHVLFPSPVYDYGYRDLLTYAPEPEIELGTFHHIGA